MKLIDITLFKIAIAGLMFNSITSYNNSLSTFRSAMKNGIDLTNLEHRLILMKWLNDWGCRHLQKDQHHVAEQSILKWYEKNRQVLLNNRKPIWDLSNQEIKEIALAYGNLKEMMGAQRIRQGKRSNVHIGATASSKILVALWPKAMMPWDDAMRKSFDCNGSSSSYSDYLKIIRDITFRIISLCKNEGFQINELPGKIGRPNSTVLELINEYIWVTETRGIKLPTAETVKQWALLDQY